MFVQVRVVLKRTAVVDYNSSFQNYITLTWGIIQDKLLILLGSHHLLIYVMPWRTWENYLYLLDLFRLLELIQESKSLLRMGIQLPESAIDVLKQVGSEIHRFLFEMTNVLVSWFLL